MGLRSKPTYRVVAIDSRRARDGKYLEMLGHYDPRHKNLQLDMPRVQYWLSQGAQPSSTVKGLIRRVAKTSAVDPAADAQTAPVADTPPADATGIETP